MTTDIKIQIKEEKESAQEFIEAWKQAEKCTSGYPGLRTGWAGLPEFRPNPFRPLGSYSGGNIFGGLRRPRKPSPGTAEPQLGHFRNPALGQSPSKKAELGLGGPGKGGLVRDETIQGKE